MVKLRAFCSARQGWSPCKYLPGEAVGNGATQTHTSWCPLQAKPLLVEAEARNLFIFLNNNGFNFMIQQRKRRSATR